MPNQVPNADVPSTAGHGIWGPWTRLWGATHFKTTLLGTSLLGACAMVGLIGFWGVYHLHSGSMRVIHRYGPSILMLNEMSANLAVAQLELERSMTADNQARASESFSRFIAHSDQAMELWGKSRQLNSDDLLSAEERRAMESFEAARQKWLNPLAVIPIESTQPDPHQSHEVPTQLREDFRVMYSALSRLIQEFHQPRLNKAADMIEASAGRTSETLYLSIGAIFTVGLLLMYHTSRALARQERHARKVASEREAQTRSQDFEARVTRGLDMLRNEAAVLSMMEEVIAEAIPEAGAEVLLGDSSRAHLHQVAVTHANQVTRCGVSKPSECPAVRRGQRLSFASSRPFDSCPHLRVQQGDPCSAVCVPLSIMGQAVGVLHCSGPENTLPSSEKLEALDMIASKMGEKIGIIRAFEKSEAQAQSDPLTGLRNRRSLEQRVHELAQSGTSAALVYCDIDHFKRLNDTHGHETGDKALRTFAQTLRQNVRSSDVVARWGGEEFVLVLPGLGESAAVSAMNSIRSRLAEDLKDGSVPGFTASFGIALWSPGELFVDALDRADEALLIAKRTGRNRVVLAGSMEGHIDKKTTDSIPQQPAHPGNPPAEAA